MYQAAQKFVINFVEKLSRKKKVEEKHGRGKYCTSVMRTLAKRFRVLRVRRAEIACTVIAHAPRIFRRHASHNLDYRVGSALGKMLDVEIGNFSRPSRRRSHVSNICKHVDSSLRPRVPPPRAPCRLSFSLVFPSSDFSPAHPFDVAIWIFACVESKIVSASSISYANWGENVFYQFWQKRPFFSDPYMYIHTCAEFVPVRPHISSCAPVFPIVFFFFFSFSLSIVVNPKSTFCISPRVYSKRIFFGQIGALKNALGYIRARCIYHAWWFSGLLRNFASFRLVRGSCASCAADNGKRIITMLE